MTLIGVSGKNHPQQVRRRGVDDTADDRRTPDELWAPLHAEFRFTLDVAASEANAKVPRFCSLERSGLERAWHGEQVWCNPPYSNMRAWVEKAWREHVAGCPLVVMLAPANRTEQKWWQELIEPARDREPMILRVRFLPGRWRFHRPGWVKPIKGDRPPFGLCLLIWERAA